MLALVPGDEKVGHNQLQRLCDEFDKSEKGVELIKMCEEASQDSDTAVATKTSPYKASWGAQFSALLWRSWLTIIKDPFLLKVRIGTSIVSIHTYTYV